jgi:hypothetical protein
MNGSLIELGIALLLVLAVAASTASFVLRAGRTGAEPIIKASFKELQKGWYQLVLSIANRAPYGLAGVSLRRVRPRSARLMAPVTSVSTRKGDFQVWSDPALDWPTTSIPLEIVMGPYEAPRGSVSRDAEAHLTAWLFLPERSNAGEVRLELTLMDGGKTFRRYQFTATREPYA